MGNRITALIKPVLGLVQKLQRTKQHRYSKMKTLIALILWFILLILCWPLAIVAIFLFPLVWLLLLPFRIIGFTLDVAFHLIKAIFLLPFKILRLA